MIIYFIANGETHCGRNVWVIRGKHWAVWLLTHTTKLGNEYTLVTHKKIFIYICTTFSDTKHICAVFAIYLSWVIMGYHGLSWVVMGCHGLSVLSWHTMTYMGLLVFILVCLCLSILSHVCIIRYQIGIMQLLHEIPRN